MRPCDRERALLEAARHLHNGSVYPQAWILAVLCDAVAAYDDDCRTTLEALDDAVEGEDEELVEAVARSAALTEEQAAVAIRALLARLETRCSGAVGAERSAS